MHGLTMPEASTNPPERLQIGISVHHGWDEKTSLPTTVDDLVVRSLSSVDIQRVPVRGALVLATADWCATFPALPQEIRQSLEQRLGYEVPLIGGSVARIYCSTDPKPLIEHGLVLLLLCSNDIWITVDALEEPHKASDEDRQRMLKELAAQLERRARPRLGTGAERYLLGILPGVVSDDKGARAYYGNELHQEILEAFDFRYRLIGGAAADDVVAATGYQFADDRCLRSGLALAVVESDLSTGAVMGHGFVPREGVRVSVDALAGGVKHGYEVTQLDGKPAAERLRELGQEGLLCYGRSLLGVSTGPDCDIAMPFTGGRSPDGPVRFNRQLSVGDRLQVLTFVPDGMQQLVPYLIEAARARTESEATDLKLILAFSCTARFEMYAAQRESWPGAIDRIRKGYLGVPIVFALCAGEFGTDRRRRPRANNVSVSLCCLTRAHARRTRTRDLENSLLAQANRVALCREPRKVMQRCLEGALKCGGIGGQICVVDWKTSRILGREVGYALNAPASAQDWSLVGQETDRAASQTRGGLFPANLLEWSRPVGQDVPLTYPPTIDPEQDILTLIVRTQQAVFVSDSSDLKFHCHQQTACLGNIRVFLAVPMIGSHGKAIATLQVAFPDDKRLDQESFDAWIGYGQRVAGALERTQEAEERDMIQRIGEVASRVIQTPISPNEATRGFLDCAKAWFNEYLSALVNLLGADGAHVRLLSQTRSVDEYHLVSAIGHLAEWRFRTRPVTREGDGSCNRQLLRGGGQITNTREETTGLNKNVTGITGSKREKEYFANGLTELESTAMLPLQHLDEILGSIVIDSKQRYFFSERRERIARAAAQAAGAILYSKIADYDRARRDTEQDLMLKTLVEASEGTAAERLRRLIARLCIAIGADVASVYIWYDTPQRLILHTAYNWFDRSWEGKAAYARGEGWTGSLLLSDEEVCFVEPGVSDPKYCTKKYYQYMVSPEHQVPEGQSDARIGIRLSSEDQPIGVVTFAYHKENTNRLIAERSEPAHFLRAFSRLLALAVEAAKRENARQRVAELAAAKNQIGQSLIAATHPDASWQSVLESIRTGFKAFRVTLYLVGNAGLESAWRTSDVDDFGPVVLAEPIEPFGPLRDIIATREPLSVRGEEDRYLLGQWPDNEGINTLLALPVVCSRRDLFGVLELVNRLQTPDHPFEAFDTFEHAAARDVADAVGAALMRREHARAERELQGKLATAAKIGAASLSGAIVMHQLMAPFTRLRAELDWLKLHPTAGEDDKSRHIQKIEVCLLQAVELIRDNTRGEMPGIRRESLRTVVREALRAIQPEILGTRVRQVVSNEVAAPLEIDLYAIVGALVNLMSNGLDAIGDSGTLSVSTELGADGSSIAVRIHNTGPSLTEEQLANAFRPGYSTKGGARHLGIGLCLAQQAIHAAGGTIQMHSPVDRDGVEVVVTLPTAVACHSQQSIRRGG